MASLVIYVALLFLLPISFLHLTRKKQESNRKKKLPPGPPGLPIIGNLHQLGHIPHRSLSVLSKKYGDVMLIHLGNIPTVIISSAEAAKEILKTHDLKTCSRPSLTAARKLSYDYCDIGFSPYSQYWRELRRICVLELFSSKRVESFRFVREKAVSSMIDSIMKSASENLPVVVCEITMFLTANFICKVAFGTSFEERGFSHERLQEVVNEGSAVLGSFCLADFFPYVGWIVDGISGFNSRLQNNFQDFDEFFDKVMEEHLNNKGENNGQEDFISALLKLQRSQDESTDGFELSKKHIKGVIMNIFLAGVDSGAITVEWAMAELIQNPRVMTKVQEEIRSYIGSKEKVEESDINNFGYLKMVIKEVLRLHPPGTLLIPRDTMSQFSINGYEIYPRTRIQVNVWAIARDPKIWENPELFYPERFENSHPIDYEGHNDFHMIPFGGGRRICPGASLAMALIELALANLLLLFDWKLPCDMKIEDLNMEECFGLATHKKEHLLLVPTKYQLLP